MLGHIRTTVGVTVAVVVTVLGPLPAAPAPEPGSVLVGCDQAGSRVVVTTDAHLDPACTYVGVDVTGSGVTLDCQGALVRDPAETTGGAIEVTTPVDVPQSDVTVRHCRTEGYTNGIRVTRVGFRELAPGAEYDDAGSGVVIEDSTVTASRGVGIYVDGYVVGTTIRRVTVTGAGSTGVYLEAGSKDGALLDSELVDNGYGENGGDEGSLIELGGVTFRYWGPGREGLAVDGSRANVIRGNTFSGNSNGGIFLYKNCGEFVHENPERWFERRHGAEGNVIEGNTFVGGRNGVWVGSRMGENVSPMDCSDPPYVDDAAAVRILDRAAGNTIRDNTFEGVTYGVRVEDDDTVVAGNTFTGSAPGLHAVAIGTGPRTEVLDHPVTGTRLEGNTSTLAGNADPYRWAHGHEGTVATGNTALGAATGLCEGPPLPMPALIFVEAVAVQDPSDGPPVPRPPGATPVLGVLPPCPRAPAPVTPPGPTAPPATPIPVAARFTG